jgi:hypothetical protein
VSRRSPATFRSDPESERLHTSAARLAPGVSQTDLLRVAVADTVHVNSDGRVTRLDTTLTLRAAKDGIDTYNVIYYRRPGISICPTHGCAADRVGGAPGRNRWVTPLTLAEPMRFAGEERTIRFSVVYEKPDTEPDLPFAHARGVCADTLQQLEIKVHFLVEGARIAKCRWQDLEKPAKVEEERELAGKYVRLAWRKPIEPGLYYGVAWSLPELAK